MTHICLWVFGLCEDYSNIYKSDTWVGGVGGVGVSNDSPSLVDRKSLTNG